MFSEKNGLIMFADDKDDAQKSMDIKPWRILIVDDENDVHTLTKMVLAGYTFQNRPLKISSVFSGAECIEFLKVENDIAIILLDVVMETDHAGLDCVKQIREALQNHE